MRPLGPIPDGFGARFQVDRDPGGNRRIEFRIAFARPGEADAGGVDSGCRNDRQFARRGDVEAIDLTCHEFE